MTFCNEVVQGIALKLGDQQVHPRGHQPAAYHGEHHPLVLFQVGQDFSDAEKGQGTFFLFIFHYASTSSLVRDWIS